MFNSPEFSGEGTLGFVSVAYHCEAAKSKSAVLKPKIGSAEKKKKNSHFLCTPESATPEVVR